MLVVSYPFYLPHFEPIHKVNEARYIPYINLSSNCPTVATNPFVLEFWSDLTLFVF
jgi:hypothetical protein